MIKKRVKKIAKLTFLIGVRQIWKLLCNIYHLLTEPFLTLKRLKKTRDKSQIFLISLTAISPIILYISARVVWDFYRYKSVLPSVGKLFEVIFVMEIIIFSYLFYWVFQLIKKKKNVS
jgi:hypothetical protein